MFGAQVVGGLRFLIVPDTNFLIHPEGEIRSLSRTDELYEFNVRSGVKFWAEYLEKTMKEKAKLSKILILARVVEEMDSLTTKRQGYLAANAKSATSSLVHLQNKGLVITQPRESFLKN